MATLTLKLTLKERQAIAWLAGNETTVDPPHVSTLLELRAFDLVGVLGPINNDGSVSISLTEAGKAEAAKGLPAPRTPRKAKAATGGKGAGK